MLIPPFAFDKFICSADNLCVLEKVKAIANAPGSNQSNPVLLYGPSGAGKSYLLKTLVWTIKDNFPEKEIVFSTGESFLNKLFYSSAHENIEDIYGKVPDVFVLDDFQVFAGMQGVQANFYHYYLQLYEQNKQILLSSDRLPTQDKAFDGWACAWLESGLVLHFSPPDRDARIAFIRKKAQDLLITFDERTVEFLADRIQPSFHQMETAIATINIIKHIHAIETTFTNVVDIFENRTVW